MDLLLLNIDYLEIIIAKNLTFAVIYKNNQTLNKIIHIIHHCIKKLNNFFLFLPSTLILKIIFYFIFLILLPKVFSFLFCLIKFPFLFL